jgi:3-deoxy-D-manno-octulosonic-acid transferase
LVYIVYNLLLLVFSPAVLVYYLWRVFISRKSRDSWRGNLGGLPCFADRPEGKKLIWLHAVSVGELVASLPIQDKLRRMMPDAIIMLTTVTKTGNDLARKSAKEADAISYLPLDYPLLINRALDRVRPDVLVLMEAEVWPNLLAATRRRNIPIVLANGRISDFAMTRRLIWRWLASWAYANVDHCCMQTEDDAERVRSLGARPETVHVLGSTKFDQGGAQLPSDAVAALKTDLGIPEGDQVFIAGSTNPGEDEPVLTAYAEMRNGSGRLRLVIAPRQIDRAEEIRTMAASHGLKCARRSRQESFASGSDVLILDTLGELAEVYAVGDIAFVGGTFIPKGGHSLVQPILQGKPVLFGPHTFKTRDIAQMAMWEGVGFEVDDAHDLAVQGKALLSNADRRAEIDATCRRLVSENHGASARGAQLITELLGAETGDHRP